MNCFDLLKIEDHIGLPLYALRDYLDCSQHRACKGVDTSVQSTGLVTTSSSLASAIAINYDTGPHDFGPRTSETAELMVAQDWVAQPFASVRHLTESKAKISRRE